MRLRAAGTSCAVVAIAGCGGAGPSPEASEGGFRSGPCNLVSDDEVNAVSAGMFTKVVASDAGCFWQENTIIGSFGAGMGISTWWYRGSDMDAERTLERQAGRTLSETAMNGNKGFQASDDNTCSIYVTKGSDGIAWPIQTLNRCE